LLSFGSHVLAAILTHFIAAAFAAAAATAAAAANNVDFYW
jgi:hypothetical protein